MDLVINYQNFYEKRIRDLGTLKYAMRSIENNADLFENIFLFTMAQIKTYRNG